MAEDNLITLNIYEGNDMNGNDIEFPIDVRIDDVLSVKDDGNGFSRVTLTLGNQFLVHEEVEVIKKLLV